jgi:peptidoglycan/xylan/chitin deacetylase (PgdA/CDA1 family)
MRRPARQSLVTLCAALFTASALARAPDWPADTFAVLCYHEIRDDVAQRPDSYTLATSGLALQFAWLRGQGYHVISLTEVIDARRDHRPLPPKAVVLTFDDGLQSVYSRAFPLLQAFQYPAVIGLVGAWLEEPGHGTAHEAPRYGETTLSRADFLQAPQIAAMQRSGLIEIASHTYGLHQGIIANPQGNQEPAAVTRAFDPSNGRYEDQAAYTARVQADLALNSDRIEALTGVRPRLVIWPYGEHNSQTDRLAAGLGMPYGMSLESGLNTPDVPLDRMRRVLITHDTTTAALARVLGEPQRRPPVHVVQVDLDQVFDADGTRQEANLSRLLERVHALGVNAVYLKAFSDPAGAGRAEALYFPNRYLPVHADLLNRVTWQLRTRAGVDVYAWLPLGAFDLAAPQLADEPASIAGIYADLFAAAPFQGLLVSGEEPADAHGQLAAALVRQARADRDYLLAARLLTPGAGPEAAGMALPLYDYVAQMIAHRDRNLPALVKAAARQPTGIERTVFLLPAADGAALGAEIRDLRRSGARNVGFGADDFLSQRPAVGTVRSALSLQTFPDEN